MGLALVVVGAFLPWVHSGDSTRSSFAMVRSADRLGIVDDGAGLVLLRAWYLMPLVAAAVVVLVALDRLRPAAVVGLVLAAITAPIALLVTVVAPEPGSGPLVVLVGAAVTVGAAIALAWATRGGRRPGDAATAGG